MSLSKLETEVKEHTGPSAESTQINGLMGSQS